MSADLLTCPECGYTYPPGSITTPDGVVLDLIVESGGRSSHPVHCARSQAPRQPSLGVYQQSVRDAGWKPTL